MSESLDRDLDRHMREGIDDVLRLKSRLDQLRAEVVATEAEFLRRLRALHDLRLYQSIQAGDPLPPC